MKSANVELELVKYRTSDVEHASVVLLKLFAHYSGIFGTEQWVRAMFPLLDIIRRQKPVPHELNAEGVSVAFSGFPRPVPVIKDGERIVYQAREPRFTIEDRLDEVLPSRRTHIERVTAAIAEEMQATYKLLVTERRPLTLAFPKERYAAEVAVFQAALLR